MAAYREVRALVEWCQENNLSLIMDFRKQQREHVPIHTDGTTVERVKPQGSPEASPGAHCLLSRTPTAHDVTGRPKRSSRTSTTQAMACSPRYHPEGEVSTGASKLGPRD